MLCAFVNLVISDNATFRNNRVDIWIDRPIKFVMSWLGLKEKRRQFWRQVIEKSILSLNDQQLVTGTAILIAGFYKFSSISVYHFSMAGNLAWLSSSTHLMTLIVMKKYFHDHKLFRNTRVLLLTIMGLLLLINTIFRSHEEWFISGPYPAHCLVQDMIGHIGKTTALWMLMDSSVIVIVHVVTIMNLYNHLYQFFNLWFYQKPIDSVKFLESKCHQYLISDGFLLLKCCAFFIFLNLFIFQCIFSVAATIIFSTWVQAAVVSYWLTAGMKAIFLFRDIPVPTMEGSENDWTFGQIVAILLLVLTVLKMREIYHGKFRHRSHDAIKKTHPKN